MYLIHIVSTGQSLEAEICPRCQCRISPKVAFTAHKERHLLIDEYFADNCKNQYLTPLPKHKVKPAGTAKPSKWDAKW